MTTALIDGDIVCYASGFANVEKMYTTPDGSAFKYKADAVHHCTEHALDVTGITKTETTGPLEYALGNVKKTISTILEKTHADDYIVMLSGSGSFRKELAESYKANRDSSPKPPFYEDMRDYLYDNHPCIVSSNGLEADDLLGFHSGDNTVICSLDKDLMQIQGWHYDWRKNESVYVSSDEGDLFFWKQMLMGDPADNILGIRGIGPKTADKLLDGVPKERRPCVVGLWYAIHFDDPETQYKTNAQLLFIQR